MKKILSFLIICFVAASACNNENKETIAVTGILISKDDLVMANIGSTQMLVVTIEPSDAANTAVEWFTDNPAVAAVNANGEITAVGEGTAIITVRTIDGIKTATCLVTVVGCCMCDILDPCVVNPQLPSDRPVKPGYWDYPVDSENRHIACQIPEEVLFSVSTEELTDIVLRYPNLWHPFVFNNLNTGGNVLYDEFNGIRELFKREDAAKELLKHYNCMMQDIYVFWSNPDMDPLQVGGFIMDVRVLEFLLGFLVQKSEVLSKKDLKLMLQCLVCAHEKEFECYDPNFQYPWLMNFYVRAHVIVKMDAKYLEIIPRNPVGGPFNNWHTQESCDIINELSYQLIK